MIDIKMGKKETPDQKERSSYQLNQQSGQGTTKKKWGLKKTRQGSDTTTNTNPRGKQIGRKLSERSFPPKRSFREN